MTVAVAGWIQSDFMDANHFRAGTFKTAVRRQTKYEKRISIETATEIVSIV